MPNTEKPTTKAEQKKSGLIETSRKQKTNEIPIKQQKSEDKKIPEPKDEPKLSKGEKKEEKKKCKPSGIPKICCCDLQIY